MSIDADVAVAITLPQPADVLVATQSPTFFVATPTTPAAVVVAGEQNVPAIVGVDEQGAAVTVLQAAPVIVGAGAQGPAGPPGAPGGMSDRFVSATSSETVVDMVIGTPVYFIAPNNCRRARANSALTKDVFGFVANALMQPNSSGFVQTDGIVETTVSNWALLTGNGSGLIPGRGYFLAADAPGMLTITAPDDGNYCARVGRAVETTQLVIEIEPTVLL